MATLNATNLKHASSSSNNIVLAANGSVNIPTLTTNTSFGKILQVQQTKLSSAVSVTGTSSYADISSFSVNITPASSSNKILVMVDMKASTEGEVIFQLVRNTTAIGNSSAGAHSSFHGLFGNSNRSHYYDLQPIQFNFLDDAENTNAHTYKVQWSNITNVSTYLNRTAYSATGTHYSYSGTSTLTVMEVAA